MSSSRRSKKALFRYSVVAQVLVRHQQGETYAQAVKEVSQVPQYVPNAPPEWVKPRTLRRWVKKFREGGFKSLEPASRRRTDSSIVLSQEFLDYLAEHKESDSRASVPELIRRAVQAEILSSPEDVDRTTVWRACKRMGLPTRSRPDKREADTRRFSYPNRMMMMLCDGKHFRAGAKRLKRVALFFIDDATRYAPHVVVGPSESTELFLRGLYGMLRKVGYFDIIYLDKGPGFISWDTHRVIERLTSGVLIHGKTRYPEGRGKVEVFNKTAQADILRGMTSPKVDPHCDALTLRLQHYLDRHYNVRPHDALGNMTPRQRWEQDTRHLRFPERDRDLRQHFVLTETRTVSADHIIRYKGGLYETPSTMPAGEVEIERHLLDDHLWVWHGGRYVQLHPVDLAANATRRRKSTTTTATSSEDAPPTTAAMMDYERQYAPLVDADGGFSDKE